MKFPHQKLLILFYSLTFSTQLSASHVGGGSVTYQYTGNTNEYKISVHSIESCFAIFPTGSVVCYSSLSAGISGTLTLSNTDIDTIPYQSCGGALGFCSGGDPVLKISHWGIITLPVAAPDWVFSYMDCCMDGLTSNILYPSSRGIHVFASLDNLNTPGNSSPQFNDSIYYEYCIGSLSQVNYSCYDVDGDSLAYSLIPAHESNNLCPSSPYPLLYAPAYSFSNPLSSFVPVAFYPSTGILEFVPQQIERDLVSVQVNEYRNGILISTITREDVIATGTGFVNPDLIKGTVFYDINSNGLQDSSEAGLKGINLMAQPYGFYATTDSTGNYSLPTYLGNYTITMSNMFNYCHSTPANHSASFTMPGQTDSLNDFALTPDSIVTDLALHGTFNHLIRPCDTAQYTLTVYNSGTDTSGAVLYAVIPSIFNVINTIPPADSVSGNNYCWIVPTMLIGETHTFIVNIAVGCNISVGTQYCDSAWLTTMSIDINLADNILKDCGAIVSSCDPNYKEVSENNIQPSFILNHDWLYYTIHFQNIGTAPALVVDIKDAIDKNLEAGSFEMISSSHPCSFNLTSTGLIDFYFYNINLPDSTNNEPASHGFVQYRIKTKTALLPGDQIHNTANIYFDFNAPIATNTTITTVGNVASINENSTYKSSYLIFPNPFTEFIRIKSNDNNKLNFELMDMMGKVMITKQFHQSANFSTSGLAKGIYFYRIYDAKGVSDIGKLIKQ